MKNLILLLAIVITISCNQNHTNEKLIGIWESEFITLKISKSEIIRTENGKMIKYETYELSGDTLKMKKGDLTEKHLVEIKDKNKLIFSPVNPYDKDIELIDESVFYKSND